MTMPIPSSPAIHSPCVLVCFIDPAAGLCLGCLRDIDEVASWSGYSDAERARIMADLPSRHRRIATVTPGTFG